MSLKDQRNLRAYIDFLENESRQRVYPVGITSGIFTPSGMKLNKFNEALMSSLGDMVCTAEINIKKTDWWSILSTNADTTICVATLPNVLPADMMNCDQNTIAYSFNRNINTNILTINNVIYNYVADHVFAVFPNKKIVDRSFEILDAPGTLMVFYEDTLTPIVDLTLRIMAIKEPTIAEDEKQISGYHSMPIVYEEPTVPDSSGPS